MQNDSPKHNKDKKFQNSNLINETQISIPFFDPSESIYNASDVEEEEIQQFYENLEQLNEGRPTEILDQDWEAFKNNKNKGKYN